MIVKNSLIYKFQLTSKSEILNFEPPSQQISVVPRWTSHQKFHCSNPLVNMEVEVEGDVDPKRVDEEFHCLMHRVSSQTK